MCHAGPSACHIFPKLPFDKKIASFLLILALHCAYHGFSILTHAVDSAFVKPAAYSEIRKELLQLHVDLFGQLVDHVAVALNKSPQYGVGVAVRVHENGDADRAYVCFSGGPILCRE